jgi:hypothetical protein
MSWGAVAVGGATILANLYTSEQNRQAEQESESKNMGMSDQELAEQRRQYDIGREDRLFGGARQEEVDRQLVERFRQLRGENIGRLDPYTQAGAAASQQRAGMLGLGTAAEQRAAEAKFKESPGQKFLRERQEKTLLRNAAAMGSTASGNVMTALQEQAFNIAATDRENYLRQLGQVSGEGMGASGQIIGMGQGPQVGETSMYADRLADIAAGRTSIGDEEEDLYTAYLGDLSGTDEAGETSPEAETPVDTTEPDSGGREDGWGEADER